MSDVLIYTTGLIATSVCVPADMPREEIEAGVNAQSPTGIDSPWRISDEPTFSGGQPNPCPCEQVEGRLHYLLHC